MNNTAMLWTGYVLSALAVLFLLMDAGMKVAGARVSVEATAGLGFDPALVTTLGAILLVATLLYAFPRTALLGAILVTGYLGGAIAVQLQHKAPLFSHVLFGVYLGLFVWGGLFLRSPALRGLIPLMRD